MGASDLGVVAGPTTIGRDRLDALRADRCSQRIRGVGHSSSGILQTVGCGFSLLRAGGGIDCSLRRRLDDGSVGVRHITTRCGRSACKNCGSYRLIGGCDQLQVNITVTEIMETSVQDPRASLITCNEEEVDISLHT